VNPSLSAPGDVPALRRLWAQAFGDGDELLDYFFSRLYRPEDAFVIREDGVARAMAFQLPMTVCAGARGWRAAYLYAVATDRAAQGKGYCTRLLDYAGTVLAERGCKALLLVPGEPGLRDFYRARGYADFSTVDRFEIWAAPETGGAERIEAPEYLELRERILAGRTYVSCPVPALAFQARIVELSGGGLYRLSSGETEGCACVAVEGAGKAVLYELLWPGEREQGASLAAKAVGAKWAAVRTPGAGEPFSMVRWLTGAPALESPYLGIALD